MTSDLAGLLFLAVFALLIPGAALAIPALIAPKGTVDLTPYESGMKPVGSARLRFSVKFYLVSLLFIIFDVEVIYLYPWAIRLRDLGWPGFFEVVMFVVILGVGYLFILKKRALDWD
ncbi:MAG: NADH-quinone oxidoreductase subunit A [Nitrospirae bacterium]|nr:NADH-quinone oxidoreductase subunit A [Nitrospirota bacterium]